MLREGLLLVLLFAALRTALLQRPSLLLRARPGGFADLLAAWFAVEVVFYRWLTRRTARLESALGPSRWRPLRRAREITVGLLVLLLGLSLAGGAGPGKWVLACSALLGVEVMFYRWVCRRFWRFSPPRVAPPLDPKARAELWRLCLEAMRPEPGLRSFVEGWFFGRSFGELRREDLENWLSWALFSSGSADELSVGEVAELASAIDVFESMVAEELAEPGFRLPLREPSAQPLACMRMSVEPLRYRHFPLSMYVFTQGLLGFYTDRSLRSLGFKPFQAGGLWRYWLWQPKGSAALHQVDPVFFVHGVGVGLLPYLGLVRVLMERGVPVFLLEVPFISLKIDAEVPAAPDTARAAGAILQLHGFEKADFVGHSFGTVILSWVWRYNPSCVGGLALLDPVVVLLHSHHTLYNFLYRKPRPWNLADHISSEFFLSHGLRRHLCWYESILWPQELQRASVPFLAVCAAEDEIASGPAVHSFLQRVAREEPPKEPSVFEALLLPGRRHGDVLTDPEAVDALRHFLCHPPSAGTPAEE